MFIEIDNTEFPPRSELRELDSFGEFKVVTRRVEHTYVSAEEIQILAGSRADADWRVDFQQMVEYAKSKGWVREDGAIRAHVEWLP